MDRELYSSGISGKLFTYRHNFWGNLLFWYIDFNSILGIILHKATFICWTL